MQEEVQEGQEEEEAVPEDLLRAWLPRLKTDLWRHSLWPTARGVRARVERLVSSKGGEGQDECYEKGASPDPRKLGCAHKGPGSRVCVCTIEEHVLPHPALKVKPLISVVLQMSSVYGSICSQVPYVRTCPSSVTNISRA